MAKAAFDKIKAGLEDAIAYAQGDHSRGKTRQVRVDSVDVSALRARLKMSQDRFAAMFGINAATLRNWEQGRRRPEGPARVLLYVIERNPKAVLDALTTPRQST
jgi:putative transcriptional regulator